MSKVLLRDRRKWRNLRSSFVSHFGGEARLGAWMEHDLDFILEQYWLHSPASVSEHDLADIHSGCHVWLASALHSVSLMFGCSWFSGAQAGTCSVTV